MGDASAGVTWFWPDKGIDTGPILLQRSEPIRDEDTVGDRTPLVLIHADWTDSGIWDPVIPLLRDRYRVIRYDLHGFGAVLATGTALYPSG